MLSKEENEIVKQSFNFSLRIVKLYKILRKRDTPYGICDQVLRSGTSIGANVSEGQYAYSRADFLNKMTLSLKEANETRYWIELLHAAEYINDTEFESIQSDCNSIMKMLSSITKTTKDNLKK